MAYYYAGELVRVVDGDTVRLKLTKTFDIGFYITQSATYEGNFRLIGIDTPEVRGPERKEGLKVKEIVKDLFTKYEDITVYTYKPDKYGRWLADIYLKNNEPLEEIWLNKYLLENGYAEPYLV